MKVGGGCGERERESERKWHNIFHVPNSGGGTRAEGGRVKPRFSHLNAISNTLNF